MTAAAPSRPWWKKKRWRAALSLWLAIAYPATMFPAAYCTGRGWISGETYKAVYSPVRDAATWAGLPTRWKN